jgi:hypothetical protein
VTQAYVGLALGRGLGAGPCLIWLVDGPIGIEEPLAVTGVTRPSGRRTCMKQRMASDRGRLALWHHDHLVRLGASEMRLQEFVAAAFRRPLARTFSLGHWNVCFAKPAMAGKTVSAHRVENGVGPQKPDHSLWLLKWLDEPRRVVTSIYRSGVPCLVLLLFPQRQNRFCARIQCSRAQSSSKEQEVHTISDKDLKAPFVKTRSEESVPRPAGDDKLEPESKKYLGSVSLFHEENRKNYNQFVSLVTEQLRPTNILEEIWVKNYVLVCGGATFKSLQTKSVLYRCGG